MLRLPYSPPCSPAQQPWFDLLSRIHVLQITNQSLVTLKTPLNIRSDDFLSHMPPAHSGVACYPFSSFGQKKKAFGSVEQFSVTYFRPNSK